MHLRHVFFSGVLLVSSLLFQSMTPDTRHNPKAIRSLYQGPSAESYRFVVTGDNRGGDHILQTILKEAEKHNPRFLLHTGDFVSDGFEKEYQNFLGYISAAKFPVLATIGNHEIYNSGRQWYTKYFGPGYFAFQYGQDRFIFVDNADGKISKGQMNWLEHQLQQPSRYKFVAMHKPPRNFIWFHAFTEGAREMMDLVEKYKANYVFLGHIHIYDKLESKGVNYVVSGGAGAPLYRMPLYISPDGGAFNHYLLMDVSPQGVKEEIIRLKP